MGVHRRDDIALRIQQPFQQVGAEENVAVGDEAGPVQPVAGASQRRRLAGFRVAVIVHEADSGERDRFLAVAAHHGDVVQAAILQDSDQALDQGLAAEVQHAFGALGGERPELRAARGREQHHAARRGAGRKVAGLGRREFRLARERENVSHRRDPVLGLPSATGFRGCAG